MIYLILLISLLARLIRLDQSFWLDEAINVSAATSLDYRTLFYNYSLGDFHPPLFHLILKSWSLIFPHSEIFARFPSVIFGVGTIWITYLIAKKLYDEKTALISATLLATAPLHIYYSQEARMYSLAAFFTCLSVYYFISLLKKDNLYHWLGFIISTSLMLYSDYLPYFLVPTYLIYLLLFKNRIVKSKMLSFFPALLLILISLGPWLLVFPKQLETGLLAADASPAWSQVVGAPTVNNLAITFVKFTIGRISFENNLIYVLTFIPVALFVSIMFLLSLFRLSRIRTFLIFWFFLPILLSFLIAFFIPIFAYFRFIFVLPAFYIIWASAINNVNIKKLTTTLLLFALSINLISLSIYFLIPKFQREDWKGATNYVFNQSTTSSIVLFESVNSMAPFNYYNKNRLGAASALSGFSAQEADVYENISRLTKDKNQVFLFQYLSGITDPDGIVFEEVLKQGFMNTTTRDFPGVGFVYEFKR